MSVETDRPALLVVFDYFYPGWSATVRENGGPPRAVPLYRTNRVMRGVFLNTGNAIVHFTYRPRAVWIGGTVSLLAWVALAVWLIRANKHK